MSYQPPQSSSSAVQELAVSAARAAKMLGLGVRTVWAMKNRGELPYVREGSRVIFPVDGLKRWLESRTEGGVSNG